MKLYNDYNNYLKNKYGCKVYRIGIDAGFTCPNRDGTKGSGGCVYCNEDGSRSPYAIAKSNVKDQLCSRIEYLKEKRSADKFIAYFQAFSNTYAPADTLKEIYDSILDFDEIVGISIGTRPDCIDKKKLEIINSYGKRYDIWLEYGLQSINDKTLKCISRGHNFNDFLRSFKLTKEFSIPVCVHVIIGLPGEGRQDIINTAQKISELGVNGVKIHVLHVLRGSALEEMYQKGEIKILDRDEYVNLTCDFLENLSADIIVQRLTGQGVGESHIAPAWALDKLVTIEKIKETLIKRGSYQGFAYSKFAIC